jgi:putative ABC transport system permease protein
MLLRLITIPYLRKHLLRGCLTIAGIVLGVAVFVGMHTANQSVLAAFQNTVNRIAGKAQLQVSAGESGFDEAALERVQSLPEVTAAAPVIEATLDTGLAGQGSLLILAVDFTGDQSVRDYDFDGEQAVIDDPLVFLAQPDSLMVTREFAERNGLAIQSRLPMSTMEGRREFVVRGIMKSSGMASAFGGNLAVMDIYAAQKVFGRGRKFDRIDLLVKDGVAVAEVRDRLRAVLGPAFTVEPPSARGAQFEALLRVYSMTANLSSIFALFIGMFIIYNTFEIAVGQRRTEIGILRALGASRAQIRGLFLIESGLTGLVGASLGSLAGLLLARGMAGGLSGFVTEIYGVAQQAEDIALNPLLLGGAMVIGVVTSVIAGWIPARDASEVDPVKAIQKGREQAAAGHEGRARGWVAVATAAGALGCLSVPTNRVAFYLGYVLSVVSAVLLAPAISALLARLLRPLMATLQPVEGALAADSILLAPRRSAGAVTALMLSLAMVVALGGMTRASYESIKRWLDVSLNPDLYISPSESLTARSFRFPATLFEDVRAVPGVDEAQRVRSLRVVFNGSPVLLIAIEIDGLARRVALDPVEGDKATIYRRAAAGEGVIVSENFSLLYNVHRGETIEIPSPQGMLRLPVLGVIVDYSDQQGTVFVDRSVFLRVWQDDTVNVFRIYVKPGADPAAVRQSLLSALGDKSRVFVLTNDEVRRYVLKLTDQWFAITYVQLFVAVLVAVLGIVNALTVSITDRRRELGVLRAVGGLNWQVRKTIWLEAFAIGLIGLVMGLALGAANLFYVLELTKRDLAGLSLAYQFPYELAMQLLPVILGTAFVAAIGPAESAVRASLVEALEYE